MTLGLLFALLSGICNGLFTTPMKLVRGWKWENIWLVFIVTACVGMPPLVVWWTAADAGRVLAASPAGAVRTAASFGFAWGFGAILFGLSVHTLGVSLANSLVIGLSSAAGSVVPLILGGTLRLEARQLVLFLGILTFLAGVRWCGAAGRTRDASSAGSASWSGYLFALGSGLLSAVFNIGYSLAQPIATTGRALGETQFGATNCIWLVMLGAGAVPNLLYCVYLMRRNSSASLLLRTEAPRSWGLSLAMGLLWGGSIFLYGAATPRLGEIGPSIGWPLSLATGLLVANLMGWLLGEWREAPGAARRKMLVGIGLLLAATALCAASSAVGAE
jgi:L-rhamnose-H+ transport protein